MRSVCIRTCLLGLALLVYACAPHVQPVTDTASGLPVALSKADSATDVWLFRHKVQVDIPRQGVSQRFDGIMRYAPARRTLHVAGLAGLGMGLFELYIDPEQTSVISLHPSLKAFSGVTDHIAATVRHIWFDGPEKMQHSASSTAWQCTVSAEQVEQWPALIRCEQRAYGYTVTIRTLLAERELPL